MDEQGRSAHKAAEVCEHGTGGADMGDAPGVTAPIVGMTSLETLQDLVCACLPPLVLALRMLPFISSLLGNIDRCGTCVVECGGDEELGGDAPSPRCV